MRTEYHCLDTPKDCDGCSAPQLRESANLVLFFGGTAQLADPDTFRRLKGVYPNARVVGCSTAGQICGTRVFDDTVVATAFSFAHTRVALARTAVEGGDSRAAGGRLAAELNTPGLCYVLLLSDGLKVNGSELADAMREILPESVVVTGGLAGDGDRFSRTLICADAPAAEGVVVALGFYGERLRVGFGSLGGWDPFGPERLITRARGNVLHELDGQSALALYKDYLGPHAEGLPATALLFPLTLRGAGNAGGDGVVRTVLGINEAEQSMTFAGDMPEGAYARLMKANFDRLVDGAVGAARESASILPHPEFALLISCVGRRLILRQRTEEEVEGVRETLGGQARMSGFYSYGEICPGGRLKGCELHNQTMTITTFSEAD